MRAAHFAALIESVMKEETEINNVRHIDIYR